MSAKSFVSQSDSDLKYKYVLSDSWFSLKENMTFIRPDLNKHFVMAIKSNRTVATSEDEKKQGNFTRIDSLQWSSQKLVRGWLKGLDFPVLLPIGAIALEIIYFTVLNSFLCQMAVKLFLLLSHCKIR